MLTLPSDFSKVVDLSENISIDLEQYGVDIALYLGSETLSAGIGFDALFQEKMIPVAHLSTRRFCANWLINRAKARTLATTYDATAGVAAMV